MRTAQTTLLLLFTLCACAYAQVRMHEKVDVQMVNVYLSAMDNRGKFIVDLRPEDLILKEDGIPQSISSFTNFAEGDAGKLGEAGIPLTVALVVDVSQSMDQTINGQQQKIDIVKNAAFRILDELAEEDRMLLITFNDGPSEITSLTGNIKKARQDLLFEDVKGGNTALLDSIYFALQKMKGEFGRKIIVVCSDGEDTASYLRFDEVLSNLIASDVTILAFGTMALNSSSALRGHYTLQKLAESSGGYAFFPTSLNELDSVMEKLRQGMRSQYSLAYHPMRSASDGTWRKIEIESIRPGLKLRYREGYHAGQKEQ